MLLDRLAHLDLLRVTLLSVQLGPQAAEVLRILALLMALTSGLLAGALLMIETLAVKLAVSFCSGVLVNICAKFRWFRDGRAGEGQRHTDILVLGLQLSKDVVSVCQSTSSCSTELTMMNSVALARVLSSQFMMI